MEYAKPEDQKTDERQEDQKEWKAMPKTDAGAFKGDTSLNDLADWLLKKEKEWGISEGKEEEQTEEPVEKEKWTYLHFTEGGREDKDKFKDLDKNNKSINCVR